MASVTAPPWTGGESVGAASGAPCRLGDRPRASIRRPTFRACLRWLQARPSVADLLLGDTSAQAGAHSAGRGGPVTSHAGVASCLLARALWRVSAARRRHATG
jgi:hypothetical protein